MLRRRWEGDGFDVPFEDGGRGGMAGGKNTLSTRPGTKKTKETHTEVGEEGMESGEREPSRWSAVRVCCDRCGARWPGARFEVICLRSMVG